MAEAVPETGWGRITIRIVGDSPLIIAAWGSERMSWECKRRNQRWPSDRRDTPVAQLKKGRP